MDKHTRRKETRHEQDTQHNINFYSSDREANYKWHAQCNDQMLTISLLNNSVSLSRVLFTEKSL